MAAVVTPDTDDAVRSGTALRAAPGNAYVASCRSTSLLDAVVSPNTDDAVHCVTALREAHGDADIVATCRAVSLLYTGVNYDAFVEAGGLPVLVDLVRTGTASVKEHAAYTIRKVTQRCDAHMQAAVDAGVLPPLATLLVDGDAKGKENAAYVMSMYAYNDRIRADVLAAGVIESLAALLLSREVYTSIHAAHALFDLAKGNDDVQQQMLGSVLDNARAMTASTFVTVRGASGKPLVALLEPLTGRLPKGEVSD